MDKTDLIKPLWKTVWNAHILDKLYYVHKSQLSVDDMPITAIQIEGRDVTINGMGKISDTCLGNAKQKVYYFLNKVDAETELVKYVTEHLDKNSEENISNPTLYKHYQKVLEYYNQNLKVG